MTTTGSREMEEWRRIGWNAARHAVAGFGALAGITTVAALVNGELTVALISGGISALLSAIAWRWPRDAPNWVPFPAVHPASRHPVRWAVTFGLIVGIGVAVALALGPASEAPALGVVIGLAAGVYGSVQVYRQFRPADANTDQGEDRPGG